MAYLFQSAGLQYIDTANAIVTAAPLTIGCWFKAASLVTGTLVSISKTSSDHDFWVLQAWNDGVVYASADDGTSAFAGSTATYGTGSWHHACGIYTSTQQIVYLDGANKGTNTASVAPSGVNYTSIGSLVRNISRGDYIDSHIAEFAVWNAALTDDEVASLGKGVSPQFIRPSAIVEYLPMVREFTSKGFTYTDSLSPATVSDHTRMIYPRSGRNALTGAAAPASTPYSWWAWSRYGA